MRKLLSKFANKSPDDAQKEKTRRTPKRKRVVPLWRRPQTIAVGVVCAVMLIGGISLWSVKNGYVDNALNTFKWGTVKVSSDMGLTVQELLVTGRHETSQRDLLKALNVARGASILAYNFAEAKDRVENLPWVQHVRIERLLPDTVAVHIIERKPMALWQHDGQFSLVDESGVVIGVKDLTRFHNLIRIVGRDAPDQIGGLLELLETQPELLDRVEAAVRVSGRRWDLSLDSGVSVRLPEQSPSEALARLAAIEQESGVLSRDIQMLDLRIPDRVIVRHKQTVSPEPQKDPGQKT